MKFIVMLLVLFLLTDPVLAGQRQNDAKCQSIYHDTLSERNLNRSQILYFFDNCVPADAVNALTNSDEPQHQKRLQTIDTDKRIITIKS